MQALAIARSNWRVTDEKKISKKKRSETMTVRANVDTIRKCVGASAIDGAADGAWGERARRLPAGPISRQRSGGWIQRAVNVRGYIFAANSAVDGGAMSGRLDGASTHTHRGSSECGGSRDSTRGGKCADTTRALHSPSRMLLIGSLRSDLLQVSHIHRVQVGQIVAVPASAHRSAHKRERT